MKRFVLLLAALLLTACALEPRSIVTQPTTARPTEPLLPSQNQGAIFQAANSRMLFEERVARHIGDLLTIAVQENLSATNKSDSSATRTGNLDYSVTGNLPMVPGSIEKFISSPGVTADGSNTFAGKGATTNSNTFTGTIAVTVVEVMPNGNLVVGGDRQIAVNGQVNTLRFTGVVNPMDIQAGNTISSTKVADARIEQVGKGYVADAQTMGWLQRFFLNVLPF
ncbi:flagellar basal body L-ring protein FlgH [Chitiniphilus eburneus]|uniref:Flagellar L-ring protein n=1 Tax=Chitiniphilus eburneus TaxID=2571148 RepID=A0A4U0PYY9_9NEIS|nr:flagellar basal body L-ring protein FlgH [Chitiniphilus eburneus]TJZ73825.1 flagellar basal body L-ring protein FlgH [Chitiniphilus eburneus]